MIQSTARRIPRRIATSKLSWHAGSTRRFLSTAPPAQKSRSWKSSAARWAAAASGIYYYNTSSVFAEEPEAAIQRLDETLHQIQESNLTTVDAIVEQKRLRQADEVRAAAAAQQAPLAKDKTASESHDDAQASTQGIDDLEDEADQQGAFNPETGEINWDCPCLGGMAHGPCGEEFKAAFSCFVYSTDEPKGMECIDKFKGMQDCFRLHPEMYGSELDDDEDDVEEELRAEEAARTAENPSPSSPSSSSSSSPDDDASQSPPSAPPPTSNSNRLNPPDSSSKNPSPSPPAADILPKAVHDTTTST